MWVEVIKVEWGFDYYIIKLTENAYLFIEKVSNQVSFSLKPPSPSL